jgi:hypothetical protein
MEDHLMLQKAAEYEKIGRWSEAAQCYLAAGIIFTKSPEPATTSATAAFEEAHRLFKKVGDVTGALHALSYQTAYFTAMGQKEDARKCWQAISDMATENANKYKKPILTSSDISNLIDQERYQEAADQLKELALETQNKEVMIGQHVAMCLCHLLARESKEEAYLTTSACTMEYLADSPVDCGFVARVAEAYWINDQEGLFALYQSQKYCLFMESIIRSLMCRLLVRTTGDGITPLIERSVYLLRWKRQEAALAAIIKKAEELIDRGLSSISLGDIYVDDAIKKRLGESFIIYTQGDDCRLSLK